MILLLLLLFRLHVSTTGTPNVFPDFKLPSFDDALPTSGFQCHLLPPEKLDPELTPIEEPSFKYLSAKVEDYKPYRMLFVYDEQMSPANRKAIEEAAKSANDRFSRMVKGPVLRDIRLPRMFNKTSQNCVRPQCTSITNKDIPGDYVMPCRNKSDPALPIIPEDKITENASSKIQQLNDEGYSLTVFVFVHGDGANIPYCESSNLTGTDKLAAATMCRAGLTNRPTHGIYFWCRQPKTLSESERSAIVLHESLHIVTAGTLIGVGSPSVTCATKDLTEGHDENDEKALKEFRFPKQCENKIWKSIDTPWKDENGTERTFRVNLAITPSVVAAARSHFGCQAVEGAELETKLLNSSDTEPSSGHWSFRLFSDELMSPLIQPTMRLSNFTLGALKDSGWYDVDLSKAEPLLVSPPKEDGCDVAKKNCHEIIEANRKKEKSINLIGPYCDNEMHPKQLVTPLCSNDGSTIMYCAKPELATQYCPITLSLLANQAKQHQNDTGYDNMECKKATVQDPVLGGKVGEDTMCVTFTTIPFASANNAKALFSFCVERKCLVDSVVLHIKRQKTTCEFVCKKAMSNQVHTFPQTNQDCIAEVGNTSLICPDFDLACPTTAAPTSSKAHSGTVTSSKSTPPISSTPTTPSVPRSPECRTGLVYEDENDFSLKEYISPAQSTYVPFKILFVYDSTMSSANRALLENEGNKLNAYLASFLKAPRLTDVRRARKWNATAENCTQAACYGGTIPIEFTHACYHNVTKKLIKEAITEKPTSTIAKYNAENYTLVVFVAVHQDPKSISYCQGFPKKIASAAMCQLDSITRRPTHGHYVWCQKLSEISPENLVSTLLREVLHIITGGTFIGAGLPALDCTDPTEIWPTRCENKTWKTIEQPWMDKYGNKTTRNAYFVITPEVKKAAQEHFKCPHVEGAELPVWQEKGSDCVNQGRWNMRLYHDEVLAQVEGIHQRLSNLTLAALKDSGWFYVNMSIAKSMVISRPREPSCDAATRSCHEIMIENRGNGEAKLIEPFCDKTGDIISSRCSMDGKTRLNCTEEVSTTDYCPILMIPQLQQDWKGFDSPVCEKATSQPNSAAAVGGRIGANTTCVTIQNIPSFPEMVKPKIYALCIKIRCNQDNNSIQFRLKLRPSNTTCRFWCDEHDANQVIIVIPRPRHDCIPLLGNEISFVCPDYHQVCPSNKTVPMIIPSTPAPPVPRGLECRTGPLYQDENEFVDTGYHEAKKLVPYKIRFAFDPNMSKKNKERLKTAAKHVNKYLAQFLKAPQLEQIRRARKWNAATGKACFPATCYGATIPGEYVLPCYKKYDNITGRVINERSKNITEEPSANIIKYNKENYTLVAFVIVHNEPKSIPHCNKDSPIATASMCQLDPRTRRPTHGIFFFCQKPSLSSPRELEKILLREGLQIITGGTFIGAGKPAFNCTNPTEVWPDKCENITWKTVEKPWIDKDGKKTTRTAYVVITKNVAYAAKRHFNNCSSVEGAELPVYRKNGKTCVEPHHWNRRLFSEDIMSQNETAHQHVSTLTFAALRDTHWYKVNRSYARPMVVSRPRASDSCDAAEKSCYEILSNNRANDGKPKLIEPYCDSKNQILSSRCSMDGKTRLHCMDSANDPSTDFCPILIVPTRLEHLGGYDSAICKRTTFQEDHLSNVGGQHGTGTICVTFTSIPKFKDPKNPSAKFYALCVGHVCDFASNETIIQLIPTDKQGVDVECSFTCTEKDANQIITAPPKPQKCVDILGNSVTLICPDFQQVCRESTRTTSTSESPESTPTSAATSGTGTSGTGTSGTTSTIITSTVTLKPIKVNWCQERYPYEEENEKVKFGNGAPDPKTFALFSIKFVYRPGSKPPSSRTEQLFSNAFNYVNKRLASLVTALSLTDVRRARKFNDAAKKCIAPVCFGLPVPGDYALPCMRNGAVIKEPNVPEIPSSDIKSENAMKRTLVVFVNVHGDTGNVSQCETPDAGDLLVGASYCQLDPRNGRPTHGALIFCKIPTDNEEEFGQIMLHKTLHILTAGSLIGGMSSFVCADPTTPFSGTCSGITFKAITQNWVEQDGKATQRTAYVAITPNVKIAAQGHFDCKKVEGAELSTLKQNGTWCVDPSHWNHRLFSDEIMAGGYNSDNRISALTLAVLKDSGWYGMEHAIAERLVVSPPNNNGCDVATKSCHEVLSNVRTGGKKDDVKFPAPYCDESIMSSRCSNDHRSWLSCLGNSSMTNYCPILIALPTDNLKQRMYDSAICENVNVTANESRIGALGGNDSICVTFTKIINYTSAFFPNQIPLCVNKHCPNGSGIENFVEHVIITLLPVEDNCSRNASAINNGTCYAGCMFKCYPKDSNKIREFPITEKNSPFGFDNCVKVLGNKISLICPDFYQVCPPPQNETSSTTKIATSSTTTKSGSSAATSSSTKTSASTTPTSKTSTSTTSTSTKSSSSTSSKGTTSTTTKKAAPPPNPAPVQPIVAAMLKSRLNQDPLAVLNPAGLNPDTAAIKDSSWKQAAAAMMNPGPDQQEKKPSSGTKHEIKAVVITLFAGVIFAKVWFQII